MRNCLMHIITVHDFWVSQNLFWKSWQLQMYDIGPNSFTEVTERNV